jgi:hypothetical protein
VLDNNGHDFDDEGDDNDGQANEGDDGEGDESQSLSMVLHM